MDILFLGCSCVDYSNMNNSDAKRMPSALRKYTDILAKSGRMVKDKPEPRDEAFIADLGGSIESLGDDEVGESNRTFLAALFYVAKYRPRVVIMENVLTAPWLQYEKFWFPKIGYAAAHVKVDSKDYYIPHTRNRGYLVAVDMDAFGDQAADVATRWRDFMARCERPASSPVTDFLLEEEDSRMIRARAEMDQLRERSRESDWATCSLRHNTIRHQYSIPAKAAPFSRKVMHGLTPITLKFPGQAWRNWLSSQTGRVIDYLDICYYLGSKWHKDFQFKTMVLDISQNIDRSAVVTMRDSLDAKFGLISCITPSGQPYITNMMRPVTGIEALMLQGMPVDSMTLASETQSQLLDLAGNAMTLTVVGASILSILAALPPSILDSWGNARLQDEGKSADAARVILPGTDVRLCVEPASFNFEEPWTKLNDLIDLATKGTRTCFCPWGTAQAYIKCCDCGATACEGCCGNPAHHYVPHSPVAQGHALSTSCAVRAVQTLAPSSFALSFSAADFRCVLNGRKDDTSKTVLSVIQDSALVFYLTDIRITEIITVIYESEKLTARLVVSSENAEVQFFLSRRYCLTQLDANESHQSVNFQQPIAVASWKDGNDTDKVEMSAWVSERAEFNLPMSWSGREGDSLVVGAIPTRGLRPVLSAVVQGINQTVTGQYDHKSQCGTAENWLWAKREDRRTFLFKDCTRTQPSSHDGFVWAHQTRKLEGHEYRQPILQISPTFNFCSGERLKANHPAKVFVRGFSIDSGSATFSHGQTGSTKVAFALESQFLQTRGRKASALDDSGTIALVQLSATLSYFPATPALIARLIPSPGSDGQGLRSYYKIPGSEQARYRSLFALTVGDTARASKNSSVSQYLHGHEFPIIPSLPYFDALLHKPRILWTSQATRASKKREPWEDPIAASAFEKGLVGLPEALTIAARLTSTGQSHSSVCGSLDWVTLMNPQVLASRAASQLFLDGVMYRDHRPLHKITTTCKIQFCYSPPDNLQIAPFYDALMDSTNLDGIEGGISGAAADTEPDQPFTETNQKLRQDQISAVRWLVARERQPDHFPEAEVAEEINPHLGVRISSKACFKNDGTFPSARGGIAAHEIGFGKTVVTLALLQHQREYDRTQSIATREMKDPHWVARILAKQVLPAGCHAAPGLNDHPFIHLKATLILVPFQIVNQWTAEAVKFLGTQDWSVITIKNLSQLRTMSISSLMKADIIVASFTLLSSIVHETRILDAAWTEDDQPPASEREREHVYCRAIDSIRTAVSAFNRHTQETGGDMERAEEYVNANLLGMIRQKAQADHDESLSSYFLSESRRKDNRVRKPKATTLRKGKQPEQASTSKSGRAESSKGSQEA